MKLLPATQFPLILRHTLASLLYWRTVQDLMTFPTKRDQVGFCVVTKGAPSSHVVNIEIFGASTFLTAPTIALQDFFAQSGIYLGRHTNSRGFLQTKTIHVASFIEKLVAQTLMMNNRWAPSVQDFIRLRPSPKQRPRENRRRSFRGSSPEIYQSRA